MLIRILLLPLGLIVKCWSLAKEGARDIHNTIRFNRATIDAGCCINEESTIASNTHLFGGCIINNCKIESYTYIGKKCIIQNTTIGSFCSIANDVLIGLGKHPLENLSTSPLFYRVNNPLNIKLIDTNSSFEEYQPVKIGNDVWVGARAIILDGIAIGHGAVIAANSVVTKDVPPYAIVGGVPAKVIKYRFSNQKIKQLLESNWWQQPITSIKKQCTELNS
jgi:acetyltransferase-like isoleucine patch superfamily enzyme